MFYTVLGFNQEELLKTNLDMTDLMILNYIMNANGNPTMSHVIVNEVSYVWLSHKKFHEDLPILKISEGTFRNRLCTLKQDGWILSTTVKLVTGSKSYYSVSSKATSLKNDIGRHSTVTSDNTLTDKALNTNNSTNVELQQPTAVATNHRRIKLVDTPESVSNKNTVSTEKPKKKNLYQSCAEMIEEFAGEDTKLKNKLIEFLGMRLELRDRPFGTKTFKGYLNRLRELTDKQSEQLKIIQYSIDRQYPAFYELKTNYNKGIQNQNVFSEYGQVKAERRSDEVIVNVQF